MDGLPVRFYRYRYLNYWEAELPVGWIVRENGKHVFLMAKNHGGMIFSLWTTVKTDWEKSYEGTEENKQKVLADYRVLNEDEMERKPKVDYESWNEDVQASFRTRGWRFRSEALLINIYQSTKSDRVDAMQDSIVDRFVRTLSLVES